MAKREDDASGDVSNSDNESSSGSESSRGAGNVLTASELARRIKVPTAICVASKRNTGKTLLISALIQALIKQKKVSLVLVMSQTAHVNDDYWFLPARMRQPFSEDVIKKMMDAQAKLPKAKREQVLLVLDDVLSDKDAEKSRFIKKCYTLGRHYDISIVLISQTSNVALTPAIKQNSDYILYSRLNRYQLGSLWESLTNIDKREFIRFSEENNKNYMFLCVDNTSQSNKPADFLLKVKVSKEEAAKLSPPDTEDSDAEISSSEDSDW
jgi:hypothetical protein